MFIYYMDVESKDVSLANTTLANYQSHFAFFRFDGFHYSYPDFGEIALKPEIHWLDKYINSIQAILPSKLFYFSYDILHSIMNRSKLKRYKK